MLSEQGLGILIVNATPHEVAIQLSSDSDRLVTFPPSGLVPRVATRTVSVPEGESTVLVRAVMGEPEGLPEKRDGVVFIVSTIVLTTQQGARRDDLLAPHNLQRGADGRPTHCLGFSVSEGMTTDTMKKINAALREYASGARTPADDLAHYRALVAESDPPNKEDR